MARVDFYVLERADEHARQTLACKLAEKAYRLKNTVYIHARSREDAERLDQLLWTFRDGSFVPHGLSGAGDETDASAVLIGSDPDSVESRDLLINLCDEIPTFANTFPRVAELVTSDENCRLLSRKRFVEYREKGHSIQTHKL
ncbi:MAG: DNA polymerase III subunit chi [Gammaproteobacteria bacterium]|nr:DNA polymerase III subunit chi [Gammaproteobacteria bacterium]MBU2676941.1 DNA polymerase III subunit chi [Gammaproteobacteria bacterium]NNC56398.1 DNA polymerase III subunit chi [Woeseiaceae bacterium]NNL50674.1 DNA polymerase III subunit chi [Woeseiaceae bacterium]